MDHSYSTNTQYEELLEFFKSLADENRLKIIGLLSQQPYTVEQLSALLNLRPSTISHHLARLSEAGLVRAHTESYYNIYELEPGVIEALAHRLLSTDILPAAAAQVNLKAYDQKVLSAFLLPNGRIKTIPAQRKKLEVILHHIIRAFTPGVHYPEKQVNQILNQFHEDHATLRRELIGHRLLARQDGEYWRTDEPISTQQIFRGTTMNENTQTLELMTFFKTLSNADRLTIAGLLGAESMSIPEIAARLNLRPPVVSSHIDSLMQAGLVHKNGTTYQLDRRTLEQLSRQVLSGTRPSVRLEDFEGEDYDRKVLHDFLQPDGRLKSIPMQQRKLLAVLNYIGNVFEPGERYPEKRVNELLSKFHEDTASLRRYLVDFGLLERDRGTYWRAENSAS